MAHTKQDYDDHARNSPARDVAKEVIGDEQFTFAVQRCGGELAKWRAANHIMGPLRFVFHLSPRKQQRELANVFFAAAKDRTQFHEGMEQWFKPEEISFQSRKHVVPLLAADMLAWTTAAIRSRQVFLRGAFLEASQIGNIFLGTKHILIGYLNRETLQQWERAMLRSTQTDAKSE
jgi:hypothetical protein